VALHLLSYVESNWIRFFKYETSGKSKDRRDQGGFCELQSLSRKNSRKCNVFQILVFNNWEEFTVHKLLKRWALLSGLMAAMVLSASSVSAQSYVSKWSAEGDANDSSGINHGSLSGNVWIDAAGQEGSAFHFNGGKVVVPDDNSLDITNFNTISLWFKTVQKPNGASVLITKGSYQLHLLGPNNQCGGGAAGREECDGAIVLSILNGGSGPWRTAIHATDKKYHDGEWHHVVGMLDHDKKASIWVDGEFKGKASDAITSVQVNGNPVIIGNTNANTTQPFIGLIDEVAIYDRPFEPEEIEDIAAGGPLPGNTPPLVSLVFEDFSDLSGFSLHGSATGVGGQLRLTGAFEAQAGSAFLSNPISLAGDAAFSAAFSFQMTNPGGQAIYGPTGPLDEDGPGADGLAFVVASAPAVGASGQGIGYEGIPNSIGVEFDTWNNSPNHPYYPTPSDIYGDDDGNHIAVNINGDISSPIGYTPVPTRMNNGALWYAWIDYNGQTTILEVRLSQSSQRPTAPSITVSRDLALALGDDVYIGFTSATGAAWENHDIVGLQFNNTYDPIMDVPGPSNSAPVADAGTSAPVEAVSPSGTAVTLDGSGSSDPDGDALTYAWSAQGITFDDATSATPTGSFPVGATTVSLTVDDGNGETATDDVVVTITDGTAPTLTIPGSVTAECADPDGTPVEIGSASATDNGDANPVISNNAPSVYPMGTTIVTWTATDASGNATSADQTVLVQDTTSPDLTVPGDITAEATSPAGASVDLGEANASDICDTDLAIGNDGLSVYPLGSTTVTWTATDASDNATSGGQVVNIVDTTPPVVSFALTTDTLWPPNHKMVQVASGISASDIADEDPSVVITVTSDEDINGSGDGNTDVDWEVNNGSVYLRAERDGGQDGRVYTVTVVSTDASGNTTTVTGTVEVPHDQKVASAGNGKGKGKAKKLVVVSQSVTPILVVGDAKVIAGQASGVLLTQGESVTVVGAGPVVADPLIDLSGNADVAPRMQEVVVQNHTFSLSQNHPNPFNPETVIGYALGEASDVRLIIYNVLGQQVRELVNASQAPGQYQVRWDGRNALGAQVTSGVYIYRLVAGTKVEMRKMILLK